MYISNLLYITFIIATCLLLSDIQLFTLEVLPNLFTRCTILIRISLLLFRRTYIIEQGTALVLRYYLLYVLQYVLQ